MSQKLPPFLIVMCYNCYNLPPNLEEPQIIAIAQFASVYMPRESYSHIPFSSLYQLNIDDFYAIVVAVTV